MLIKSSFKKIVKVIVLIGFILLTVIYLMNFDRVAICGYQIKNFQLGIYVILSSILFFLYVHDNISTSKFLSFKANSNPVTAFSFAFMAFNASYVAKPFDLVVFLVIWLLAIVIGLIFGVIFRTSF